VKKRDSKNGEKTLNETLRGRIKVAILTEKRFKGRKYRKKERERNKKKIDKRSNSLRLFPVLCFENLTMVPTRQRFFPKRIVKYVLLLVSRKERLILNSYQLFVILLN
jgi:hypothetical protein